MQFNKTIPEQEIIEGLRMGGSLRERSETQLYQQYYHLIREGKKKYGMSEERAASAYSEAIIAVIRNIVTSKYEARASLGTYLYSIYWNKCVDELRSDASYREHTKQDSIVEELFEGVPDQTSDIIKGYMQKQDWQILKDKLAAIGDKCKEILMLWANHYKDQEIAELMQYTSAKSARVTRFRCLEKLQKETISTKFNYE